MITDYEKFRIADEGKQHELLVEVNWSKEPSIVESRVLRLTFPNGDVMLVKRKHLNALLFALGNAEEQRQLTPTVTRRSRWYETVISVKAVFS